MRWGGESCWRLTLISSTWLTMVSAKRSTPSRTLPINELACAGVNTNRPTGFAVTVTSLSTTWPSERMMCLSTMNPHR